MGRAAKASGICANSGTASEVRAQTSAHLERNPGKPPGERGRGGARVGGRRDGEERGLREGPGLKFGRVEPVEDGDVGEGHGVAHDEAPPAAVARQQLLQVPHLRTQGPRLSARGGGAGVRRRERGEDAGRGRHRGRRPPAWVGPTSCGTLRKDGLLRPAHNTESILGTKSLREFAALWEG